MAWNEVVDSYGVKSWESKIREYERYILEEDGFYYWMIIKNDRVVLNGKETTLEQAKAAAEREEMVTPEDLERIERYANGQIIPPKRRKDPIGKQVERTKNDDFIVAIALLGITLRVFWHKFVLKALEMVERLMK